MSLKETTLLQLLTTFVQAEEIKEFPCQQCSLQFALKQVQTDLQTPFDRDKDSTSQLISRQQLLERALLSLSDASSDLVRLNI